jgi:hypothetical protein
MTSREFIIDANRFDRRVLTELQHKLRAVLKCYTITDFSLNEDSTFIFKKSYMVRKIRIDDPKKYSGFYQVSDAGNGKYKILISVIGPAE